MATSDFDLVIRRATIADGTGGQLYEGDVAITGGCIAQVGKVAGRGQEEIDANGLLLTPGFIDVHTHYDGQAVWADRLLSSSWHGVTTAIMGNCGVGFAPVRRGDERLLVASKTSLAPCSTRGSTGSGNRSATFPAGSRHGRTTWTSAFSWRMRRCVCMSWASARSTSNRRPMPTSRRCA
jgi:N-acyl-D-aspartate/D-glutamate deacylase